MQTILRAHGGDCDQTHGLVEDRLELLCVIIKRGYRLTGGCCEGLVLTSHIPVNHAKTGDRIWPLVLLTFIGFCLLAVLIFSDTGVAPSHPADQGFVYVDLEIAKIDGKWKFAYPHLQHSGGISASLLVGLYKLAVTPHPDVLNWHVRILGAALFVVAAALLFQLVLTKEPERLFAEMLVLTSGFALLEPT